MAKEKPQFPLEPPNTESPRSTYISFVANIDRAYRTYKQSTGDTKWSDIDHYLHRAVRCLDLSQVAPALVREVGLESSFALKEVFDRIEVPPKQKIPGTKEVEVEGLTSWRFPHSEIIIKKIEKGLRQGEFLFSPNTVSRAVDFYRKVRSLPYKPGSTPGILSLYRNLPGPMIPLGWIEMLPQWMKKTIRDQAIWQWLGLIGSIGFGMVIMWLTYTWERRAAKKLKRTSVLWYFVTLALPLTAMGIPLIIEFIVVEQVNISGPILVVVKLSLRFLFFVAAGFFVVAVGNRVAAAVISSPKIKPKSIDAHMVRIGIKLFTFLLAIFVVLEGASYLGVPLAPILAGLGVGGIAVALAAQGTVENLIGGFTLFADRPVRVGDFCRVSKYLGTIEEIGLRSTRIRTLDRTVVTIPNGQFAKMELENYSRRDRILFKVILSIRKDTTLEQLSQVLENLQAMLINHEMIIKDKGLPRIRYIGIEANSLNLEIFAYASTNKWDEFLKIRQELLQQIMEIVRDIGTNFAFPSQTVYLAQDEGVGDEGIGINASTSKPQ